MLIDTHTHIPNPDNVDAIILSGADPAKIEEVFDVAQSNPKIFCTLGIHPDHVFDFPYDYERMLSNPKVVGIGEIGLEYHYAAEYKKEQMELFEHQIEIARRNNMPVAIHSRDADDDTMMILKNVRGVMHCFAGGYDFAKAMLDRGFFISASGIVTFKNSSPLRETFSRIPLDRIVVETDSPFCAPVPFRGQECRPAMVREVIKCVAEIKNIPLIEMENILWDNAHRLYPKLCQDKL